MSSTEEISHPGPSPRLHLAVCLGVDFDCAFLPHLYRHYAPAVDSWNFLLHTNDVGEEGLGAIAEAVRTIRMTWSAVDGTDGLHMRDWRGEFAWLGKINRLNQLVEDRVPEGDWVLYIDADEFVDAPARLKTLLTECNARGSPVVFGRMVDRFAQDRLPHPLQEEDDLFAAMPHSENYTQETLKASAYKPCLMRYQGAPLLLNCHDYSGQSWRDYRASGRPVLTIWHFKWVESTREKLRHRVRSFQRQGMGWWRESANSLRDIYREDPNAPGTDLSLKKVHPYLGMERRAYWKTGLSEAALAEIWHPKWQLLPADRVVTFGSCFAQHLGPALRARGFNWWETEPAPASLDPENARRFGYGIFSCRTGAITTPTALLQWLSWAFDKDKPPEEQWPAASRFIDPFRPTIEPGGFCSAEELVLSRQQTLESLKRAVLTADVFLFTLGMTESWVHQPGGWVYPACPGTVGGQFDPETHHFHNLALDDVQTALSAVLELLWSVRPNLRILLTVSPVPLTATASGQHVLAASSGSKAILRTVAGQLAHSHSLVDYFPAYEIVTAPSHGEPMFEPNRRSVSALAVSRVMDAFFAAHSVGQPEDSTVTTATSPVIPADDCDDAWAEAFER